MSTKKFIVGRDLFNFMAAERIYRHEELEMPGYSITEAARASGLNRSAIRNRELGIIKGLPIKVLAKYARALPVKLFLVMEPDIRLEFSEVSGQLMLNELERIRLDLKGVHRNGRYSLSTLGNYIGLDKSQITQTTRHGLYLDILVQYGEWLNRHVYAELEHNFLHTGR